MVILVLCLLSIGFNGNQVQASEMKFGVNIILPENQRGNIVGHFDMLMEPGSQQVIEIEIVSVSDEPITVLIEVANAVTDSAGVVHYQPQQGREVPRDETLVFAFKDMATMKTSRIHLEPRETVRVPITIKMPEEHFDGVVAGGFGITQEFDLEAAREETKEMIIHVLSFEVPVIIRQNETRISPDLNLVDAYASQRNWRNIVAAHLQNPERMFINQMNIYARVTPTDSNETLFEQFVESRQMAPNSNFIFSIPLNGERFTSGDFLLHMEVDSENGRWSFVREFHITSEQARTLNEMDVSIVRTPLWIFIATGGGVLFVVFVVYMTIFKRKSKKTTENAINELLEQIRGE